MKQKDLLTKDQIDTLRYMVNSNPDIIKNLVKLYILTEDFVTEFKYELTPELFTTSHKLSTELADNHPELFSEEIMENYLTGKKDRQDLSDKVQEELNKEDADTDTIHEMEQHAIENINCSIEEHWGDLSVRMFLRYKDRYGSSVEDLPEILYKILGYESQKVIEDNAIELIGISEKIDNLILSVVKDEGVKTQLMLQSLVNSHEGAELTPSMLAKMPNDLKDACLHDEGLTADLYLKVLYASRNDFGYVKDKLTEVETGALTLPRASDALTNDVLMLIGMLPEDIAIRFVKLAPYYDRSYTPDTYAKIFLVLKSFTEDQLLTVVSEVKATGGYLALRKYATRCGFNKVLEALKN